MSLDKEFLTTVFEESEVRGHREKRQEAGTLVPVRVMVAWAGGPGGDRGKPRNSAGGRKSWFVCGG